MIRKSPEDDVYTVFFGHKTVCVGTGISIRNATKRNGVYVSYQAFNVPVYKKTPQELRRVGGPQFKLNFESIKAIDAQIALLEELKNTLKNRKIFSQFRKKLEQRLTE